MAVSSTSSRVVYEGDGVTTAFPFAFKIPTANDLVVTYTDAAGEAHKISPALYAAMGFNLDAGGTVTYPLNGGPIAAGTYLSLQRIVSPTQPASISNQGALWPSVIEGALDHLTLVAQGMLDTVARTLRGAAGDTATLAELPPVVERRNKFLAFDGLGQPVAAAGVSSSGGPLTSFGTALIATANAAASWTLLNLKAWWQGRGFFVVTEYASLQAAVSAAIDAGGGIVWYPPGDFVENSGVPVTVSEGQVTIAGCGRRATRVTFSGNATSNSINFHGASGAYVRGCGLRDISLQHSGKTGGHAVSLRYVADFDMRNVEVTGAWNGCEAWVFNNVNIADTVTFAALLGDYGIKAHAPADGSDRADVLNLDLVVDMVNATAGNGGAGGDGLVVDGKVDTVNLGKHAGILNARRGIAWLNTAASPSFFPQFLFAIGAQIDGARQTSVYIAGGQEFTLNPADGFQSASSTGPVLVMLPDNGASVTVTGAANNGSGKVRLTVNSTTGLATGHVPFLFGIVGTTEANGHHAITVIDATHIDLPGVAFVHAWVSGGTIVTGSRTRALRLRGGRLAGGNGVVADIGGTDWDLGGCALGNGAAATPVIRVRPTAKGGKIDHVTFFTFGWATNHTYGVQLDGPELTAGTYRDTNGAERIVLGHSINYFGVQTGEVLDNSTSGTNALGGGIDRVGKPFMTIPVCAYAALPTGKRGRVAFVTNGRKAGEGAGAGTGVLAFHDNTNWIACDTGTTLAI